MKDKDQVKIDSVVLKVKGETIKLSIESARELHKLLADLFGETEKVVIRERYPWVWFPYYDSKTNTSIPTWITTTSGTTAVYQISE